MHHNTDQVVEKGSTGNAEQPFHQEVYPGRSETGDKAVSPEQIIKSENPSTRMMESCVDTLMKQFDKIGQKLLENLPEDKLKELKDIIQQKGCPAAKLRAAVEKMTEKPRNKISPEDQPEAP